MKKFINRLFNRFLEWSFERNAKKQFKRRYKD